MDDIVKRIRQQSYFGLEPYEAANEIEQLRQRVQELEKEPSVESGGEFKTWWEIALHVGAWKNHELDYVHFGSEMAVRAFAIHLLKQRDKEESQLIQTIAKLTAERDALKKLYESSEEYVIALKETRNRLAEERDEWRSKHDVACLTITNLQSKYECQLSATSKAMQGVVELTAERDVLMKQRDELVAALEWKPIETAPTDTFVLLAGPSGYTTIETVFATGRMCSDYHKGRWIDHANDDLTDWGFEPTHWMPLPYVPATASVKEK